MIRALVVGSLVMDLAFAVPKRPDAGEVVIASNFGTYLGGKGYNQAVAIARLGAAVTFVGAVGADAYGDAFLESLEQEGIDAGRVVQLRGAPTAVGVPLVTPQGAVAFIQYQGANRRVAPAHVAELPDSDVLLLQGEIPPGTSLYAARAIRRRGGLVVLNPAPTDDITPELLDSAGVLCLNEFEARRLTGTDDEPAELARTLERDGRAVVVKCGPRGAAWAAGDEVGRVQPPPVRVVDATGAGDAFCAALGLALAEGARYPEAVRFACAAGAAATTRRGAEPSLPTRAVVEHLRSTV